MIASPWTPYFVAFIATAVVASLEVETVLITAGFVRTLIHITTGAVVRVQFISGITSTVVTEGRCLFNNSYNFKSP